MATPNRGSNSGAWFPSVPPVMGAAGVGPAAPDGRYMTAGVGSVGGIGGARGPLPAPYAVGAWSGPPPQHFRPPPPLPPPQSVYAVPYEAAPPPQNRWASPSSSSAATPRLAGHRPGPMTPNAHPYQQHPHPHQHPTHPHLHPHQQPHPHPHPHPHAYQHAPPPMPIGQDSVPLLIALADVYLEVAHSNGYRAAARKGAEAKAYFKLVATGLGCLEAALKWRLQPRVEAMVRLRYASVLFDETDNLNQAEELLNKGMLVAQRNNLIDLKHRMQYLLTRIMFRTSPKAALRMLNTYIEESEALDQPLWTYSFRFLRCTLLTETEDYTIRDPQAAILTLQKICNSAKMRRDFGVLKLASLMEAMVCLLPGGDGMEAAQRALARANSQQLSSGYGPPQLEVLTQILDIACYLMLGNSNESTVRMRKLQAGLDEPARWANWKETGEFELTVNPNRQGKPPELLTLSWFCKDDVFVIGWFLGALCRFQKNVEEGGKAEKYLAEGLKIVDRVPDTIVSFEAAKGKLTWKRTLKCYMLLYYGFLLAVRTDWTSALRMYQRLEEATTVFPINDTSLMTLINYLRATLYHGTNELSSAFAFYSHTVATTAPDSELNLIAKMNQILILRTYDPVQASALMASIEKPCTVSKNALFRAAFLAVKATERGELVKTKNHLAMALQMATGAANQQLTYIVLSFMYHRFFAGVVSEQAEKSARAALQNAKKGRDDLWTLMAGEMYADCLARKGSESDAERQREMNKEPRAAVMANLLRASVQHPPDAVDPAAMAYYASLAPSG